jgi:E3 ubiquitin-protein ligase NEDD4
VIHHEIRKTPDNHHVQGQLVLQIGYAAQSFMPTAPVNFPVPNNSYGYPNLANSFSNMRLSSNPSISFPMPRPSPSPHPHPVAGTSNVGGPVRHPSTSSSSSSTPARNPSTSSSTIASRQPSIRTAAPSNPPPVVRVGPRRQNTITRRLDASEMQRAREQLQQRDLGDGLETPTTPTSDPLGPLPAGWFARTTPTGRVYYSDSNTRTTSWEDPRLRRAYSGLARPAAAAAEVTRTESGRAVSPTPAPAAVVPPGANLGPLPSGWEMRMTPQGKFYFVDHSKQHISLCIPI